MPRSLKTALVFVGGVLHAFVILLASVGIVSVVLVLMGAAYDGSGAILLGGLSSAALLLVAIPLGWFCMKQLGVAHPWASEVAALFVTLALSAAILAIGGALAYEYRVDSTMATIVALAMYLGGALVGGIVFQVVARLSSRYPQRGRSIRATLGEGSPAGLTVVDQSRSE